MNEMGWCCRKFAQCIAGADDDGCRIIYSYLKSQMRLLAARRIDLKQDKKRRFDLKPAVERIEADVEVGNARLL
jgi:hypothetical protein